MDEINIDSHEESAQENGNLNEVSEGRSGALENDINELMDRAAQELYDNSELQNEIFLRLRESKYVIRRLDQSLEPEIAIAGVEFDIRSVKAKLNKETKVKQEELTLRRVIPLLILLYVVALILLITIGGQFWEGKQTIPILGVPLSVLAWSAIGSLSAILYRLYKQELGRIRQEFWWLVARPVIGIIMGSLAYLAIVSGLLIVSAAPQGNNVEYVRPQIVWIVAFLGGFSDRFFESMIGILMGKFSQRSSAEFKKDSRKES
jgi:hypothetical protein